VIFYASLAVDQNASSPYVNNVYVLGMNIAGPVQILVSRSQDGGNTWAVAQVAADQQNQDTWEYYRSLTVGKDGAVYAAWMHCTRVGQYFCSNNTDYMLFSRSSDGGVTWSKPSLVMPVHEVPLWCGCYPFGTIPNVYAAAPNTPALGVDNSSGQYAGRLYASLYEWTGTQMRVVVIHSTDGGTTWSKPVPVAPRGETHDQFFPWLSVSPAGLVGVSWFDRRNDPANVSYQAYAAISSDGGESFQPDVQLTTAFSNPNNGHILGDYAGNTWDGPNYFIAAWMDTSNGVSSQDYVGGIRLH
jgi:Neuraminidase (sialidase)